MSEPRYTKWTFTVNNWTEADEAALILFLNSHSVAYGIFGKEVATTGTPHLQGYVRFRYGVRFGGVQRRLPSGAHIERARRGDDANYVYCSKGGDFTEFGERRSSTNQGSRTDLAELVEWGREFIQENGRAPSEREFARAQPVAYVRYPRLVAALTHLAEFPVIAEGDFRDWQIPLYEEVTAEADDRKVHFVVDDAGNKGKSWFCYKMLSVTDYTQVFSIGKREDIAHVLDASRHVVLFNVPRGGMQFLNYGLLEMIKDRYVVSLKYQGTVKVFTKKTHVVVFCNEMPDMNAMSSDRYYITRLLF